MAPRFARLATAGILQLAALVLAHQLVYVVRYGSRFGEELVHAGHGEAWAFAITTSVALVLGLLVVASARLAYLGAIVRRETPTPGQTATAGLDPRAFLRAWLRLAPRMGVVAILLLTIQENVEHALIGQALPGPGVLLSQQYPAGLWITIAIALAVSFVAALFEWRHEVLLARLRRARAAGPRRVVFAPRRPAFEARRPTGSLIGRESALRAPPAAGIAA
jgi:hypothetical protein